MTLYLQPTTEQGLQEAIKKASCETGLKRQFIQQKLVEYVLKNNLIDKIFEVTK